MEIERPIAGLAEPAVPHWRWLLAKTISAVLNPPLMISFGLVFLAVRLGNGALPWALMQIVVVVFLPALYVLVQVQRGVITDIHIEVREQRIVPLIISLVLAGLAWFTMWILDAPDAFVIFGGVATLQACFMLLVTLRWKISAHSMTIASLTVFLVGMLGWHAAPVLLTIPLVAWARISLNQHSLMQTLAGAACGILFTIAALGIYLAGLT